MADGTAGVKNEVTAKIAGKDEDIPRLVEAFQSGRKGACGGDQYALVFRPPEGRIALVHLVKGAKEATVWTESDGGDLPTMKQTMSEAAAAELLDRLRRSGSKQSGPGSLRGDWTGGLLCGGGRPVIVLRKALSTYLTLEFRSGSRGWEVSALRKETWFQRSGTEQMSGSFVSFAEAVRAAITWATTGAVSSACSMRDTHRRGMVDSAWAAARPAVRPADPASPIPERFGVEKAAAPKKSGRKAVGAAEPGSDTPADAPKKRGRKPAVPPALSEIPSPQPPSCPASTANIAEAVSAEASALSAEVNSLWGEDSPAILERAGKLIKRAMSLVESPLCTGKLREEAEQAVRTAMTEYRSARASLMAGEDNTAENKAAVREIAEQVALAAAKAGRACAGGKGKKPCASPAEPAAPARTAPAVPAAPAAPAAPAKRGRKPAAAVAAPEIDPAKDAALMAGFQGALSGVLGDLMKQMNLPLGGGSVDALPARKRRGVA